jgi:branched-chain amino acid transport system permease protein
MNSFRLLGACTLLLILVALIIAPIWLKPYGIFILSTWAVVSIAAIGLNLTLGYAGQVSLAHAAFVGIGAYTTALLVGKGFPYAVAIPSSILLAFAVGWCLGYPALRIQGHYLAFVTFAFTMFAFLVFRNEAWLTGGVYGISEIPRPMLFEFSLLPPLRFYYFCLGVLLVVLLAVWKLVQSPWGRAFVALRENPVRAMSLGVDTRSYTLFAFAIGAGLAGLSGALYAPLVQFVDPSPFALVMSINILLMVVVGGAGFFFGPILGAFIAILIPEWLRFSEEFYLIIYASLIIVMMIACPSGLFGLFNQFRKHASRQSIAHASNSVTANGDSK